MKSHGVNPFEIVLWVVAAALVTASIWTILTWLPRLFGTSETVSPNDQALGQIAYVVSPHLLVAGLAFAAIALAVRAIDYNARRRAVLIEPSQLPALDPAEGPVFAEKLEPSVVDSPEVPATRRAAFARPAAPDPSIFMRPRN